MKIQVVLTLAYSIGGKQWKQLLIHRAEDKFKLSFFVLD